VTAKDVEELIVAPMVRLYAPPEHLSGNPDGREAALREYVRALERYPRSALEKIWRVVIDEQIQPAWPTPGALVAVGRRVYRGPLEPSDEEENVRRAREMAERYAARFMKTTRTALLARREGWAGHLRSYVEAAAWVQAQWICGVSAVGFDSVLTRHLGNFDSAREALMAYREVVENSLDRGLVRVNVPRDLIERWRKVALSSAERCETRGEWTGR
jgi:hypothetical protein